jgi:release factor glutamine methyltransferase
MTVRQAVFEGAKWLRSVETPLLDAIVLLSHAAGWSKERLLASYPEEISGEVSRSFQRFIELRLEGLPVSYIRQKKEFYSLDFCVGPGVLVPRPETELLVDAVVELARGRAGSSRVHDAFTGTGCVAIAIKNELPELEVSASDISTEALSYFRRNSLKLLDRELSNTQSDLLGNVTGVFDMITANPPYLTSDAWAAMASNGWPEPAKALDGGIDGLTVYREFIPQCASHLESGGILFLEADPSQFDAIRKLLMQSGFHNAIIYTDLAGRERVIRAEKKEC